MSPTGFDTPFTIHRKRNAYAIQFLMYLDGRDSAAATWTDKEDTNVDATVSGAQLAPYGYIADGVDDYLSDNLGVNGVTITEFTIGVILSRNEMTNQEGIVYGLFGSTHYPRIYFNGTSLVCEIKLDGNVKTVTVASSDTYLTKGKPHLIVFRGSNTTGIQVLIDGTSRGTQTDTGTSFDTSTGDFKLAKDTNLSYFQKGALRLVAACAEKMTDDELSTWRTMLEYEGFFDLWRDNFSKWSGTDSFSSGENLVGDSLYYGTVTASSTGTAAFEVKDERDTATLSIDPAGANADAYLSLALGNGVKTISAAEAKTLPGVTAGEVIRVTCELFADAISASKAVSLEIDFYNESGTQQGSTTFLDVEEAETWEAKVKAIVVPTSSTRVNFTLHVSCDSSETVQGWISNFRATRS